METFKARLTPTSEKTVLHRPNLDLKGANGVADGCDGGVQGLQLLLGRGDGGVRRLEFLAILLKLLVGGGQVTVDGGDVGPEELDLARDLVVCLDPLQLPLRLLEIARGLLARAGEGGDFLLLPPLGLDGDVAASSSHQAALVDQGSVEGNRLNRLIADEADVLGNLRRVAEQRLTKGVLHGLLVLGLKSKE